MNKENNKAIFLDRDGTIIIDKVYLNDPNLVEFLPRAIEGLKKMCQMGFKIFVITNQSGIPRGLVQIENLNKIHQRINNECLSYGIPIEKFYYAPYMTDSNHPMRKPNPGMLLSAHEEYGIDLKNSWMIGDRMTDVEAGHRAQAKSILISDHENPKDFADYKPPEFCAQDLLEAATFIEKNL